MLLNTLVDTAVYVPRSERISFDLPIRMRQGQQRPATLLKNLTCGGARIEGMPLGLRAGDKTTVYLPSLKPKEATVMWTMGDIVGVEFDRPLHPDIFEELVLRHARRRPRTEIDRLTQIDSRYDRLDAAVLAAEAQAGAPAPTLSH
jgi:hypothetical protein